MLVIVVTVYRNTTSPTTSWTILVLCLSLALFKHLLPKKTDTYVTKKIPTMMSKYSWTEFWCLAAALFFFFFATLQFAWRDQIKSKSTCTALFVFPLIQPGFHYWLPCPLFWISSIYLYVVVMEMPGMHFPLVLDSDQQKYRWIYLIILQIF